MRCPPIPIDFKIQIRSGLPCDEWESVPTAVTSGAVSFRLRKAENHVSVIPASGRRFLTVVLEAKIIHQLSACHVLGMDHGDD